MAAAAVSALTGRPVDGSAAATGEISVQGLVKPVGGVPEKIAAARRGGLKRVIVPRENGMDRFREAGIQVILVDTVQDALDALLLPQAVREDAAPSPAPARLPLAAAPAGAKG